jgi:hypothetical protein
LVGILVIGFSACLLVGLLSHVGGNIVRGFSVLCAVILICQLSTGRSVTWTNQMELFRKTSFGLV